MTGPLSALLSDLPTIDAGAAKAVAERAANVIRPKGALRRLDELAIHVAGWRATRHPAVARPGVLVFAADHGVAAGGVSAYPAEVTGAMLAAVRAERATINAIARSVGAELAVYDLGVGTPTRDIRTAPAMEPERFAAAVQVGVDAVDRLAGNGTDLLVLGELGIGNTTAAAAIAAAVVGGKTADWVGRGTGLDDEGLARKVEAVRRALTRIGSLDDVDEIARQVGGAELAAMAGACCRARHHRIPAVLDGYIATAAVLPLHAIRADALEHCLAGHVSAEPGHRRLLDHVALTPILDLDLRLGEGSGALAAVPLVRMACSCVTEVPTFDEWFGANG